MVVFVLAFFATLGADTFCVWQSVQQKVVSGSSCAGTIKGEVKGEVSSLATSAFPVNLNTQKAKTCAKKEALRKTAALLDPSTGLEYIQRASIVLPSQWRRYYGASQKKQRFIQRILFLVCEENRKILTARTLLKRIQNKMTSKKKLTFGEITYFSRICARYKIAPSYHNIRELLKRVDVIPSSLALAQGIQESGWGCSRAARHKNSCFGQMANRRDVAYYPNLRACVVSYMHNLNTNSAYKEMRTLRQKARRQNKKITGIILARGIYEYCEYKTYVCEIINLIHSNGLEFFDNALLLQ